MENKFLLYLLAHEFSPITLTPTARWLLLQIIKRYGEQEFCLTTAMSAKEFVFHEKKLQTTLNELQEHQTIIQRTDDKSGKAFVKLDIEMFSVRGSLKTTSHFDIERWFTKLMNHDLPLKALFFHLVDTRLHDFYVHHLQHVKPILSGKIDFKTALVLMVLIRHSNQFGITNKCGIHKLKHKTGLSKDAIFRCVKKLKQQGLIRTRVDGTQSSKIISQINPFYALNLSHELWGDKARYGRFYIEKNKPTQLFEVQSVSRFLKFFETYDKELDYHLNYKQEPHAAWVCLKQHEPRILSDRLCQRTVFNFENSSRLVQDDLQKELVLNLLSGYFELKKFPLAKKLLGEVISYNELDTKPNNFANTSMACALFQCYLEQWNLELYSSSNRLKQLLLNFDAIDVDDFKRLENKFKLSSLLQMADRDLSKFFVLEIQSIAHLIRFLLTMITNNKLYPFLTKQGDIKQLKPFSIMPRSYHQQTYSCIFMLDPTIRANEFYLIDNTDDDSIMSQQHKNNDSDFSSFNSLCLPQLQNFGLLPTECRAIDGFADI
ncbi:helix-turn-helix domain-containing protein [Acinetobacter baumannii]|uniref:Uncharacterized protein n=1 Tax=Acinetobacter colistiniresistens TaxID=280145 RepID=N9PFV5_9GAMM|nr:MULTISPECIES: helix-turn-helix domain-containing protein [Acinetobacter]ELW99849.1 hypothetical protein ACIN5047_0564 [Acinetobacter baumannii OIFC047]ELX07502.1 hypothetical protein ACINNAV57_0560 [Acinetobacter baumannii Naval-57]ENX32474.1 hypothetical protein F889_03456 [Acinetobacter colistiniresistens]EXE19934.1 helix-turn-helix domain protein [Acinetobacter baumannii 1106579]MCG9504733.1 hypothetical protein [Acinetobacter pittii]